MALGEFHSTTVATPEANLLCQKKSLDKRHITDRRCAVLKL